MHFEYNGNLLEDDRINLVANEIVNKYSQISFERAKEAAMLEGKISSPKTVNDELNRLLIDELIEDIAVSEDGNIKVIFKYEDKYFEALDFINKQKYDIIISSSKRKINTFKYFFKW